MDEAEVLRWGRERLELYHLEGVRYNQIGHEQRKHPILLLEKFWYIVNFENWRCGHAEFVHHEWCASHCMQVAQARLHQVPNLD